MLMITEKSKTKTEKFVGALPDKITTPVIAPGPVIKGTPMGLIAISSVSLNPPFQIL